MRRGAPLGYLPDPRGHRIGIHRAGDSVYRVEVARADFEQQGFAFDGTASVSGITLRRSPAELRLEGLEQDHQRLLREIAKKKAACELAEGRVREITTAFEVRLAPLRAAVFATLADIERIFAELLGTNSRLTERERAKVRRLYKEVVPAMPGSADDAFEAEQDDDGWGGEGSSPRDFDSRGKGAQGSRADDAGYSASKPAEKEASVLRVLFRRLVTSLHPDKVQDAAEKDACTAVMKDVTRAYEANDLARLLELERRFLAGAAARVDERALVDRIGDLLEANKALRRQLRALTVELKSVKQSLPVAEVSSHRRGSRLDAQSEQLEMMLEHAQAELDQLEIFRDSAQQFQAGKLSLKDFLHGPADAHDELGELMNQVLADMMEAEFAGGAPPGKRRPQRSRGQRRGSQR